MRAGRQRITVTLQTDTLALVHARGLGREQRATAEIPILPPVARVPRPQLRNSPSGPAGPRMGELSGTKSTTPAHWRSGFS